MILPLVLVFVLGEGLLWLGVAVHRVVRPALERVPFWATMLLWHVLPFWLCWRAFAGWVLRRAGLAATRAVEAHERAQASATYPPQAGGVL
jgi:hypothetical protein